MLSASLIKTFPSFLHSFISFSINIFLVLFFSRRFTHQVSETTNSTFCPWLTRRTATPSQRRRPLSLRTPSRRWATSTSTSTSSPWRWRPTWRRGVRPPPSRGPPPSRPSSPRRTSTCPTSAWRTAWRAAPCPAPPSPRTTCSRAWAACSPGSTPSPSRGPPSPCPPSAAARWRASSGSRAQCSPSRPRRPAPTQPPRRQGRALARTVMIVCPWLRSVQLFVGFFFFFFFFFFLY